ncbi:MAG TPA: winged helix-turn-helix domain-containing protein [Pyrinomonadaceae bacterium]|jgi:DNA-binding transcriptional regulator YhcF (GntR family)|nr:winged helix-turn-helix domain-containing protein [Pyrinomonadaceae bacterium]
MADLNIRIRSGSDETKTQQIFNQIASAILAGKFTRGDALTSERALAEQLGVSRNIVRNAYRRLEDQGFVETVSTAGRRVRAKRSAAGAAGVQRQDRHAARKAGAKGNGRKGGGKARKGSSKARR